MSAQLVSMGYTIGVERYASSVKPTAYVGAINNA